MLILVMVFSSCVRNKNGVGVQNTLPANTKIFEVTEVIQASNYTYLKVKENIAERWVAVSKQDVNIGEVFYYDKALQMNNFKSKDLDRTFDEIYFVGQISKTPMGQKTMGGGMPAHSGKIETPKLSSITLGKTAGEITLSNIFEKRDEFVSKEFEIRGIVVKINKQVMGKNWIHIQDGTDSNGEFDLTITTQDLPEMNDEVTFKGKLSINKDFGSGYRYDVIMEDAVLMDKKPTSNVGQFSTDNIKVIPFSELKFTDVGAATKPGKVTVKKEEVEVVAGGADIWGLNDEFNFGYMKIEGDFDVSVQIKSLSKTHQYTKAGIMARVDLNDNSQHAYFQIFPDISPRNKNNGGCEFQYRLEKGGEMKAIYPNPETAGNKFDVNFPNTWIRLKRHGDIFESYISSDNINWELYSTFEQKLPIGLLVGLAVTSHNSSDFTTAVFSNLIFRVR